jgi:hypothetical protein
MGISHAWIQFPFATLLAAGEKIPWAKLELGGIAEVSARTKGLVDTHMKAFIITAAPQLVV